MLSSLFRLGFEYCNQRTNKTCLEIVSEPANKAFTSYFDWLISTVNNHYRSGTTSLRWLNEPVAMSINSLAFKRRSPFYESFNTVVDRIMSNGVNSKWIRDFISPNNSYRKPIDDAIGPQVLTMDDLSIGFQFCCIPLVLSVIVFLIELAVYWSKRLKKALKESLIAVAIVEAYFDSFHWAEEDISDQNLFKNLL